MKNFLYILVISITAFSQTYNPDFLRVSISTERDTFLTDEPIYIEFKQTNIGESPIFTKHFRPQFTDFYSESFIGSDGKKVDSQIQGHFDTFSNKADRYYLPPGESQYCVFNIASSFGYTDNRTEPSWRGYYLKPGKYTYQITFYSNSNYKYEFQKALSKSKIYNTETREQILSTIDRMPVKSNKLTFTIVEPDSEQSEERSAMNDIMNINWVKNQSEFIKQATKYFDKYSNSNTLYKYYIYDRIRILREPPLKKEVIFSLTDLLDKCKNTYYSYKIVGSGKEIYKDLKSDNRTYTPRIEGYKRIVKKYPNTKLAIYANAAAKRFFVKDILSQERQNN